MEFDNGVLLIAFVDGFVVPLETRGTVRPQDIKKALIVAVTVYDEVLAKWERMQQMKTSARIRATDAQIKALAAKGEAAAKEPHATAVRFNSDRDRYDIELSTGGAFAVPRSALKALPASASREALRGVRLMPAGFSLWWDALDTGYHIEDLEALALGAAAAARMLGRRGGAAMTTEKAKAARENGKRGGRPKGPAKKAGRKRRKSPVAA